MAGKNTKIAGKKNKKAGKYKNGGKMVGRQPFPYRVEGGVDGPGDNSRHILQHEGVGRVHEIGGVSLQQPTTNITTFAQVIHVE